MAVGDVGTVSIEKNCLSLSLCPKTKSQEVDKRFVPELWRVVFRDSILSVFHSMFLNEGRIVYSRLMILLIFSRFIFCSCDSVFTWLLGSVSFGSVVFSFSEVGNSFSLDCFCLTPLDMSGTVL